MAFKQNPCAEVKVYHDGDGVIRDAATGKQAEPAKEENRGRPKLRFHSEKDANKRWVILDREAGDYTPHGPYKTRREAKEMVDTLNNMAVAPPVPIAGPLVDVPENHVDMDPEQDYDPQTGGEDETFDPLTDI
jgi:hypothetical protein